MKDERWDGWCVWQRQMFHSCFSKRKKILRSHFGVRMTGGIRHSSFFLSCVRADIVNVPYKIPCLMSPEPHVQNREKPELNVFLCRCMLITVFFREKRFNILHGCNELIFGIAARSVRSYSVMDLIHFEWNEKLNHKVFLTSSNLHFDVSREWKTIYWNFFLFFITEIVDSWRSFAVAGYFKSKISQLNSFKNIFSFLLFDPLGLRHPIHEINHVFSPVYFSAMFKETFHSKAED